MFLWLVEMASSYARMFQRKNKDKGKTWGTHYSFNPIFNVEDLKHTHSAIVTTSVLSRRTPDRKVSPLTNTRHDQHISKAEHSLQAVPHTCLLSDGTFLLSPSGYSHVAAH